MPLMTLDVTTLREAGCKFPDAAPGFAKLWD